MQVDPINILQVTLYSKLITESLSKLPTNDAKYVFIILSILGMYKLFSNPYIKRSILDYINNLSIKKDDCIIIIPQHNRKIVTFICTTAKESTQALYSVRFHALNHYIAKHHPQNVNKKIEVMKKEQKSSWDNETIEYILLPMQNEKILLHKELNIFFEINITNEEENKDSDKKNSTTSSSPNKNYVYKLSKPGQNNYPILQDFLEKCVKEYEDDVLNKKEQQNFEYIKSEKDEDGKCTMVYRSSSFKSNKHLDKNVFFENRKDFISYIDRFSKFTSHADRSLNEAIYEDAGITYKAGILMYGPPGCGKTCTIRGILNRTGRHAVLIRWSDIKTCQELCTILRSATINDKKYQMRDLCFIFEDFDANNNDVLKKRSEDDTTSKPNPFEFIGCVQPAEIPTDFHELKAEFIKSKKTIENMSSIMMTTHNKKEDGLTLDCVLNVIDGIIELHDAMLIFTTNHLEKIDPAFFRPGRIDYILELKYATVFTIKEMIEYKFRHVIDDFSEYQEYFDNMKDYLLSPADIQITLLKYKNDRTADCRDCLQELVEKMKN